MTSDAPATATPLLYTTAEVARLTSLCPKTIRNLIGRGELPVVRFGRAVRIDPDDVRALIAKMKGGNGNGSA